MDRADMPVPELTVPTAPRRPRLEGLDGLRGIAALFVVLHHCWLLSFPGFPRNSGPLWVGWLLYGHLAVVVFIVLSGFVLAAVPARSGWKLVGIGRFLRRRAWRILPPYWAALVLSLVVAWTVAAENPGRPPTWNSAAVFGVLLQDVLHAPSPNSAFWSIAVEAQLYLLFPFLLLLRRRLGAAAVLAIVTTGVVAVLTLAGQVPLFASLQHLTPEFAVLFTMGMVAAGVAVGAGRRRIPSNFWAILAGIGGLAVVVLIVVAGSEWTVMHYPWIDLLFGVPTACLLAAMSLGRPRLLIEMLDSRGLRKLGSFSYSLYLVHVPIVVVVRYLVGGPARSTAGFLVTTVVAVPAALLFAFAFAQVFEIPFVRNRSARALVAALGATLAPTPGRHAATSARSGQPGVKPPPSA